MPTAKNKFAERNIERYGAARSQTERGRKMRGVSTGNYTIFRGNSRMAMRCAGIFLSKGYDENWLRDKISPIIINIVSFLQEKKKGAAFCCNKKQEKGSIK